MNSKEISIYIIIISSISISINVLYTIGEVELPKYTADFFIVAIIGFSCIHYFNKYNFKFGKSILYGIIIGILAGLISGVIIGLMTYKNANTSINSIFHKRLIVLLGWFIEATLSAVFVSSILLMLKKKEVV